MATWHLEQFCVSLCVLGKRLLIFQQVAQTHPALGGRWRGRSALAVSLHLAVSVHSMRHVCMQAGGLREGQLAPRPVRPAVAPPVAGATCLGCQGGNYPNSLSCKNLFTFFLKRESRAYDGGGNKTRSLFPLKFSLKN